MDENNDELKISKLDLEEVQASVIICDIEGTTTSISFVKDVLFPYAVKNVRQFLTKSWNHESTIQACSSLKLQCNADKVNQIPIPIDLTNDEGLSIDDKITNISEYVKNLIEQDRKVEALKHIQGLIWEEGFKNGVLEGHIFDDVPKAFDNWIKAGAKIYIYSSGSITAQKLLFHYSKFGDLLPKISGHFDLATGRKVESKSYTKIMNELDIISSNQYSDVLFFTDSIAEARAAKLAEINVILLDRPGNDEYSSDTKMEFKIIKSFDYIKIVQPSQSLNTELNIFFMLAENPNPMLNEWGPIKQKGIQENQEASAISTNGKPSPITEKQIRKLIENNNIDDTIFKLKEKIKDQQKTIDEITNDITDSTDSIGLADIKKKDLMMELERKNLEMSELEKKRKHLFENQKRTDKRERAKDKSQSKNGNDIVENLNKAQIKKMLENNLKGKSLMDGVEQLAKFTTTTSATATASTSTTISTSTETVNVDDKKDVVDKAKDKKKNKKKHKHNKKALSSIEENPKLEIELLKPDENNTQTEQSFSNDKNVKPKFDTANPFYDVNIIQETTSAMDTQEQQILTNDENQQKKTDEMEQNKQEIKTHKKLQKKINKQLRLEIAKEKKQNKIDLIVKPNESELNGSVTSAPNVTNAIQMDLSISNEKLNVKLSKAKKKKLNKKTKTNDNISNIKLSENTVELENVEVDLPSEPGNQQNVEPVNITGKKKKNKNTKKQNNVNTAAAASLPDQHGNRTIAENNNNTETEESVEIARTIEQIAKQKLKQLRRKYKQKQKMQQNEIVQEQVPDTASGDDQTNPIEQQPINKENPNAIIGEKTKVNNKNKKKKLINDKNNFQNESIVKMETTSTAINHKRNVVKSDIANDEIVPIEEIDDKVHSEKMNADNSVINNNGLNDNSKLHIDILDGKEKEKSETKDMIPDEISDKKKSKKNNKRKRNRAVNKDDGDELQVDGVCDGMTPRTNPEEMVSRNQKCQNLVNKGDNVEKQTLEKPKKRKKTKGSNEGQVSKKESEIKINNKRENKMIQVIGGSYPIPESDNVGTSASSINDEHKQDRIHIDDLEDVKAESKKRNGKRGRGASKRTNIKIATDREPIIDAVDQNIDGGNPVNFGLNAVAIENVEMNNDILLNENPSGITIKHIDNSIKVNDEEVNNAQEEPIKQQNAKRKRKAYGPRDTAKILRSTKIIETDY